MAETEIGRSSLDVSQSDGDATPMPRLREQ